MSLLHELPPSPVEDVDGVQTHEFAHGLGRTPSIVSVVLRARKNIPAYNIQAGDELQLTSSWGYQANYTVSVWSNAQNVRVVFYGFNKFTAPSEDQMSMNNVTFDKTSWDVVVRAA